MLDKPTFELALERFAALHPKKIDLGLTRIERLLTRLGNPHEKLPPVIHVAGTNGKGSTIAFMRAIAETAGLSVHTYTSPHLINFRERIVLQGCPIADVDLLSILEDCDKANAGFPITFFEIVTAAAFLAFSRVSADLVLLETGLGGRLDSTNVISRPDITVITPISLDHQSFLGSTVAKIASEKAGILKPTITCVVAKQVPDALKSIKRRSSRIGSPLYLYDLNWRSKYLSGGGFRFYDQQGAIDLPRPSLAGPHQMDNAATAIATLRSWNNSLFSNEHLIKGLLSVNWPARLQLLHTGKYVDMLPKEWELWVDGGHNPAAGEILAESIINWRELPLALIVAMQSNKDARGFLAPFAKITDKLIVIELPGVTSGVRPKELLEIGVSLGIETFFAKSFESALEAAIFAPSGKILVCGSLMLAGDVLSRNC